MLFANSGHDLFYELSNRVFIDEGIFRFSISIVYCNSAFRIRPIMIQWALTCSIGFAMMLLSSNWIMKKYCSVVVSA